MPINVNANSSAQIITPITQFLANHDVVDLPNFKAYRQIRANENLAAGDVVESDSLLKVKETDWKIKGIAVATVSSGNWGFVQSLGFGQAKVEPGTPANAFLVPSQNAGKLQALDLTQPEKTAYLFAAIDQRLSDPSIRLIVSVSAESGGMADVFIF